MNAAVVVGSLLAILLVQTRWSHAVELKDHDYDQMLDAMEEVHQKCPNITYLYSLTGGKTNRTVLGKRLAVIVLSDNPQIHELGK
ncbi:hypothetical protein NP493_786g00015 [Ridgeia piscesae]|uniref:Uncharacterized protein n=1 Tax=Ridgeia piscesae TaxID=27915 RepID=A0AAD9KN71_RIDPI|nr:hypothetical protein NP493_786g00015 [Ridgeia piscesae]